MVFVVEVVAYTTNSVTETMEPGFSLRKWSLGSQSHDENPDVRGDPPAYVIENCQVIDARLALAVGLPSRSER